MKLTTRIVEKPWGRQDIPPAFGDFGGRRIGEIWFEDPDGADAPVMIKYLFTSERLSIQVHPDDASAQAAGFARGKEECWLVLDAAADAELGVGVAAPSDVDILRAAALDGSIVDMIDWRQVARGDFVYNGAGTIHAIGAGLTVVEVQQNVDCTYRLYDYGRPRELHLDAGLAVARTTPHRDPRDRRLADRQSVQLVNGPYFELWHVADDLTAVAHLSPATIYVVPLSAGCRVEGADVHFGECARTDALSQITLSPQSRALLCWPV